MTSPRRVLSRPGRPGRPVRVAAVGVALVCAAAACGGTRLSNAQIIAANGGQGYTGESAVVSGGSGPVAGTVTGPTTRASTPTSGGGTVTAGSPGTGGGGGTTTTTTGGGSTTTGGGGAGTGGASSTSGAATPVLGSSGCTSQGTPIKIGQNGSFSGLVGNSIGGLKTGVALWAEAVNAAGGVQCHPIQLSQEDDASDPSETSSNLQDLISNKHVIAVVGLGDPITISSAQSVIDPAGIPVIGGDQATTAWNTDPLLYNQGGSGFPTFAGAVRTASQTSGGKRLGLLYCLEASTCTTIMDSFTGSNGYAAKFGMSIVYRQSFSLTQSSFTSDCQSAKSANVQVLEIGADASSVSRLLRDCDAVGFHPQYSMPATQLNSAVTQDPNFQSAAVWVGAENEPFPSTDSPGLQAFHAAVNEYLPGQGIDQNVLAGWASGQLFAAAINALGPSVRGKTITTAMVRQGLASLHGETLGGLSPPLSFPSGKPSPVVSCYYLLKSSAQGYVAPLGSAKQCY